MKTSKTQQALVLVDSGMPAYRAAMNVGLSPNTLYVAIKRRREKAEHVDRWDKLKAMLQYTIEACIDEEVIYKKPILESVLVAMEAIDKADSIG